MEMQEEKWEELAPNQQGNTYFYGKGNQQRASVAIHC
jgi:hypothetical protein